MQPGIFFASQAISSEIRQESSWTTPGLHRPRLSQTHATSKSFTKSCLLQIPPSIFSSSVVLVLLQLCRTCFILLDWWPKTEQEDSRIIGSSYKNSWAILNCSEYFNCAHSLLSWLMFADLLPRYLYRSQQEVENETLLLRSWAWQEYIVRMAVAFYLHQHYQSEKFLNMICETNSILDPHFYFCYSILLGDTRQVQAFLSAFFDEAWWSNFYSWCQSRGT